MVLLMMHLGNYTYDLYLLIHRLLGVAQAPASSTSWLAKAAMDLLIFSTKEACGQIP